MQYGVTTEELGAQAAALRTDAAAALGATTGLRAAAQGAGGWGVGRTQRATVAFFDLLHAAASEGGEALRDLGNRLGAAAGEYDTVEERLLRTPVP